MSEATPGNDVALAAARKQLANASTYAEIALAKAIVKALTETSQGS